MVGRDKTSQPSAMAMSLRVMVMAAHNSPALRLGLVMEEQIEGLADFTGEPETDVAERNGG